MATKQFDTQLEGLDPDKPNVYIMAIQASNLNGVALTGGQMDAALNSAIATLELLGAEVGATLNGLKIDSLGENQNGYLRINVEQVIVDAEN